MEPALYIHIRSLHGIVLYSAQKLEGSAEWAERIFLQKPPLALLERARTAVDEADGALAVDDENEPDCGHLGAHSGSPATTSFLESSMAS